MFEKKWQNLIEDDLDKLSEIINPVKEKTIKLEEGENRIVSIFFLDIKGFTAMSEKLQSEQVKRIIDRIFKVFTNVILKYGGYIDKYEGDLIMAHFGSKITSETDTERAIKSGLEILNKIKQINEMLTQRKIELNVRIGINTGMVTTGKIGLQRSGDFTVYGDAVNLAARMEKNAPLNSILISEETKKLVTDIFRFESLGKLKLKGISFPVDVYKVLGVVTKKIERWERFKVVHRPVYVGRDKELKKIEKVYVKAKSQIGKIDADYKPIVIGLRSPAGLGKSRLIYEFSNKIKDKYKLKTMKNIKISGYTKSYAQAPYTIWTSFIKNYIGINETDTNEIIREKFEYFFSEISPELKRNENQVLEKAKPILGFILGLTYKDIRLKNPDPKSIQTEIFLAIRYFLEAITKIANRQNHPLIIVLEDLHWLDESSRYALKTILSSLNVEEKRNNKANKILFLLLAYRNEFELISEFKFRTEFYEFQLEPLTTDNSDQMINSMLGKINIPQKIKSELLSKSEGNPFYIEEWIHFLLDEDIIEKKDNMWRLKKEITAVPDTLHKLILSRIDRMETPLKILLQKASVIGYSFLKSIMEAMEIRLGNKQPIEPKLTQLIHMDWLKREEEVDETDTKYLFKHIIACDVVYQTILIYNKKILHKIIAEYVEEKFRDNKDYYAFLANHYEKAEVKDKSREYLKKAGDFARDHYQNELAVVFYDQLLQSIHDLSNQKELEIDILLKKGNIFRFIGKWKEAEDIYQNALHLATKIKDKKRIATLTNSVGWQNYLKGNYEKAMECLEKQLKISEEIEDKSGISIAFGNMGVVFKELGNYERAMECHRKKLEICEELEDKSGMSIAFGNIGLVYWNQGNYERAMEFHEKKLKIKEELADKKGISIAVGNMGIVYENQGNHKKAMECFEKRLKISEELGDKSGISIAVGNMGIVYKEQGNYEKAMECYQKDLIISEELGNKKGISRAVGNMGLVHTNLGNYTKAMECYQKDLVILEELGNKKGISIVVGNMGNVYRFQGNFGKAIDCFEKVIEIDSEIGFKPHLPYVLSEKANCLYELKKYEKANEINEECLKIAEEIKDEEYIFAAEILKVKIEFKIIKRYKVRIKKCIESLEKMLADTKKEEQIAALNYELAIMNKQLGGKEVTEKYKKDAIKSYKKLYKKTPKIDYKNKYEELEKLK